MLLLVGFSASANDVERLAQEADELYGKKEYEQAAQRYEEVLAQGYESAELHYNLGNAYYRTDEMGRAVLNYERALRLKPTMSDAKENLALAESKTVDRIAKLPKLFVVEWIDGLCRFVSPRGWRIVWLVVLAVVLAGVVLMRNGGTLGWRKTGLTVGIVAAVLLVAVSALWHTSASRYNARNEAIVMQPAITVKGSPDEMSVDKLVLHEGTKVSISETVGRWHKITIADGTSGWCDKDAIERI